MNWASVIKCVNEHDYKISDDGNQTTCKQVELCRNCIQKNSEINNLQLKLEQKHKELDTANKLIMKFKKANLSAILALKKKKSIKFYKGLQNQEVFDWLLKKISKKTLQLQYYRGETLFTLRNCQKEDNRKKAGKLS